MPKPWELRAKTKEEKIKVIFRINYLEDYNVLFGRRFSKAPPPLDSPPSEYERWKKYIAKVTAEEDSANQRLRGLKLKPEEEIDQLFVEVIEKDIEREVTAKREEEERVSYRQALITKWEEQLDGKYELSRDEREAIFTDLKERIKEIASQKLKKPEERRKVVIAAIEAAQKVDQSISTESFPATIFQTVYFLNNVCSELRIPTTNDCKGFRTDIRKPEKIFTPNRDVSKENASCWEIMFGEFIKNVGC